MQMLLPADRRNDVLGWLSPDSMCELPANAELLAAEAHALLCSVCMLDFIMLPGAPRQSYNGHLLCRGCLDKLVPAEKVACPTCRSKAPRTSYGCNLFLEQCLQRRSVLCPLDCNILLSGKPHVLRHIQSTCSKRKVACPACKLEVEAAAYRDHIKAHDNPSRIWKMAVSESSDWNFYDSYESDRSIVLLNDGGIYVKDLVYAKSTGVLRVRVMALMHLGSSEIPVTLVASSDVEGRYYEQTIRAYFKPGEEDAAFALNVKSPPVGEFVQFELRIQQKRHAA